MPSSAEENYLKAIFKLSEKNPDSISTNSIARAMNTTPASVSDMLRKLANKKLIHYKKYKGVQLTEHGRKEAVKLIRSHRLWEVFLLEKLGFSWDQVHEIAEEMEHVRSPLLIERLEQFLGHPRYDPHGDPIPDAEGKISYHKDIRLLDLKQGEKARLVGVTEQTPRFLQHLDKIHLTLGSDIQVLELNEYDNSRLIKIRNKEVFVSEKICMHLIMKRL
ncbi:MAG: iron-dependent repressor [Chitinophagales bacterium]|nr:MAG: iron-dependent repressor [Chitinophagales bacterium]